MIGRPRGKISVTGLDSDIDPIAEETSSTTVTSCADTDESGRISPEVILSPCVGRKSLKTKRKALIIFDWDDTILPTSYLAKKGYKLDGPDPTLDIQRVLDDYSRFVNITLNEASRKGHVIIVTNAETGWIDLTVDKFLPLCSSTIAKFQHVSARSLFEPTGIQTPMAWKENAFRMVVQEYLNAATQRSESQDGKYQVVSLGDSAHEREAVLKVCEELKHKVICKSLKFMERPDVESLKKEHQLIVECLPDIMSSKDNLDLCIQTSAASDR